jgi:hypothetical protein
MVRHCVRLTTLASTCSTTCPEADQARQSWQKAAELLLAAADGLDDVGAATGQVELAIFLQAQVGAAKD